MKELNLKDGYDTIENLFEDFCSKNEARWYLDYLVHFSRECDTVLEYGTWQGQSLCAFMLGGAKRIVTCDMDISRIDSELFHGLAEKNGIEISIKEKNSFDEDRPIENPDLLFLDTRHTYDHVLKELQLHGNAAKKYIGVHDTNYPPMADNSKKVREAVKRFMDDNWKIAAADERYTGIIVLERIGV